MAEIRPIGFYNEGSNTQKHDVYSAGDTIPTEVVAMAELIASSTGNTLTLGSDGKLFVTSCCHNHLSVNGPMYDDPKFVFEPDLTFDPISRYLFTRTAAINDEGIPEVLYAKASHNQLETALKIYLKSVFKKKIKDWQYKTRGIGDGLPLTAILIGNGGIVGSYLYTTESVPDEQSSIEESAPGVELPDYETEVSTTSDAAKFVASLSDPTYGDLKTEPVLSEWKAAKLLRDKLAEKVLTQDPNATIYMFDGERPTWGFHKHIFRFIVESNGNYTNIEAYIDFEYLSESDFSVGDILYFDFPGSPLRTQEYLGFKNGEFEWRTTEHGIIVNPSW